MSPIESSSTIAYIKISGYAGAVAFFSYLNIPTEQMGILSVLMMIDFVTGVGKQFRVDKSQIKSHLAWLGVMKKVCSIILILSIALVVKALGNLSGISIDGALIINSILAIFIMAEGYSTIQNVYAIRTGKILPEFDVVSILIKGLGDFFKTKIDSLVRTTFKDN